MLRHICYRMMTIAGIVLVEPGGPRSTLPQAD